MAAVEDYIFLTEQDFLSQRGDKIGVLLAKTKEDMVVNALQKQDDRMLALFNSISSEDMKKVSGVLHTDQLLQYLNANIQSQTMAEHAFPTTIEAARNFLQLGIEKLNSTKQFKQALSQLLTAIESEYPHLKRGYYLSIKKRFYQSRGIGKQKGVSEAATPEERMFISIMDSTYRGEIFKPSAEIMANNGDVNAINGSLTKLYMLKGLLGEPGIGGAAGDDKFWESVAVKAKKWVQDFMSGAGEYAFHKAYCEGESSFFNVLLSSLGAKSWEFHQTGTQKFGTNVSMYLREDPKMQQMLKELEKEKSRSLGTIYGMSTAKADEQIVVQNNRIVGNIGITIKDYETLQIAPDGYITGNIHLQSGTNLLTLLIRECHFSSSELITFMNIGAALPGWAHNTAIFGPGILQSHWQQAKDMIKYRALLSALAGLEYTQDMVFFMSLNGRLFTIQQILNNLLQQVRAKRDPVTLGLYKNKEGVSGKGLEKSFYEQTNINNYSYNKSDEQAKADRSKKVRIELMNEMMNTRITMSINLRNLAALKNI